MAIFREVTTSSIRIKDRLRPLSADEVGELANSMRERGLLNPITLHQTDRGLLFLVAGHHRLEAAKKLGWNTIPATMLPAGTTDDDAKLAEIDENLVRIELTPAERAIHISERKSIYSRQHPETLPGGDRTKGKIQTLDFASDTAAKTGRSRASVAADVTRAKHIPELAHLVGTSLDKGMELDALIKLPEPKQADLIARAKAGEKVSAKAILKVENDGYREKREAIKAEMDAAWQKASDEAIELLRTHLPPVAFDRFVTLFNEGRPVFSRAMTDLLIELEGETA